MGSTKIKQMTEHTETVWMMGKKNPDNSYFHCEYCDNMYRYPKDSDHFITYCTKKEKPLSSHADCTMECEFYGRCDFCNGFSAIGCQVCEIPRP